MTEDAPSTGPLHALHAAVSLFTWVPMPPVSIDRATARGAILAFPWVGLGAGAAAGLVAGAVGALGGGGLLAAASGLATLAGVTGAMHLDGVADTADGLGSRKPADEALALMKRSDIGPMGVATLVLVLLVDAAALASPHLAGDALPVTLACMPMVGRVSALAGTGRWARSARPGGFGALFAGVTSARALILDSLAVLAAVGLIGGLIRGLSGAALLTLAALVAWAVGYGWQRHLQRRLGGLTGDTFGSLIEVAQLVFVVVAALLL